MRRIRILEQAAEEAIEAAAWYEQERAGLGAEFAHAIEAAIELLANEIVPLAAMPGAAGARDTKRLVLKRFPYDIVILERCEEFLVLAVAHHSRRPGYWRDRRSV